MQWHESRKAKIRKAKIRKEGATRLEVFIYANSDGKVLGGVSAGALGRNL